jgi:hypothetical protein
MSKPQINQNPLPLVAEEISLLEASLQGSWKVRIDLGVMHGSCHELQFKGCDRNHGPRSEMLVGGETLHKMTLQSRFFRKSTVACNQQLKVNWPAPMFAIWSTESVI